MGVFPCRRQWKRCGRSTDPLCCRWGEKHIKQIYLITGAILLLGALAILAHVTTSGQEFSRYNPSWNGTSDFFSRAAARGVPAFRNPSDLPSCRILLLIAPEGSEAIPPDPYRKLLATGGSLVIAAEEEPVNRLLASLNSTLRTERGNLSSADAAFAQPTMLRVYPQGGESTLGDLSVLITNRPVVVRGGEPFFWTSLFSWQDGNGNGRVDEGEVLERYPVASRQAIGIGEVFLLGDASLFINGMQGQEENDWFLERTLTTPGLCIDQWSSRTADRTSLPALLWGETNTYMIKIVVLSSIMALLALAGWRRRV